MKSRIPVEMKIKILVCNIEVREDDFEFEYYLRVNDKLIKKKETYNGTHSHTTKQDRKEFFKALKSHYACELVLDQI